MTSASLTRSAAPVADPRRWLALALLAVAQSVVVLDPSIVNTALPSISEDLGVPTENLSWIINAYVLTFGGFLLLGGRMGDLLGRRRIFVGGLVLFALASLAGGLAQSETQLVAARAIQGLGAALLAPAALSIVTTLFAAGPERHKALAVWGAVAGAGGVAVGEHRVAHLTQIRVQHVDHPLRAELLGEGGSQAAFWYGVGQRY